MFEKSNHKMLRNVTGQIWGAGGRKEKVLKNTPHGSSSEYKPTGNGSSRREDTAGDH